MGLGASVWTPDLEKAERLAARLKAGTVWFNSHHELNLNVPFGGIKESGLGAEHGLGGIKSNFAQGLYLLMRLKEGQHQWCLSGPRWHAWVAIAAGLNKDKKSALRPLLPALDVCCMKRQVK